VIAGIHLTTWKFSPRGAANTRKGIDVSSASKPDVFCSLMEFLLLARPSELIGNRAVLPVLEP
jgi:hypothetical protein